METLQAIWTNLIIPNENFIRIVSIPLTFLEVYVCMLLFTSVLNLKADKSQKLTYVLTFSVLSIIIRLFVPNPIGSFINMVLLPVLVIFIFQTSIIKVIVAEFFPTILTALLETIIAKIDLILFQIPSEAIATVPIYRLGCVFTIYLSIFLLAKLSQKFNFSISLFEDINKSTKWIILLNSLLGIIAIAVQFYLINFYSNSLPFLITIFGIVSLLAYFLISIYNLTNTTKLAVANQDIENLQLYNKTLTILHDNIRAFRHDFSNIVQTIGRLCKYQ